MMEINQFDEYLSTRKAAELLGVSLRTVQLWVENGTLTAWKTVGGHRRILMNSVYQVLKQRKEAVKSDNGLVMVLVEDDKDIRDAYSLSVSMTGLPVKVVTAANGYEGLIQVGKYQPDIIMTDLMMPKMDGFEMLKAIKKNSELAESQIIVVTALDRKAVEEKGINVKEVTLLQKPLKFETLEEELIRKLDQKLAVN